MALFALRGLGDFTQTYSYAGERATAIRNLSFTIQPGEVIAIVGRSGSGKSTLVNLRPRLYDASAGRVLIDGTDVRQYELDSLRDQIALVSQDVVLFNDTIRLW